MKKPRPFSLPPIYIDERKERLEAVARRVADAQPTLSLRKPKGRVGLTVSTPMLLSVLLILMVVFLIILFSR